VETVLVPRYYRGRLLGFVQRDDITGLMQAVGQLGRCGPMPGAGPGGEK
jgi:hypothetical protein